VSHRRGDPKNSSYYRKQERNEKKKKKKKKCTEKTEANKGCVAFSLASE